MRRNKSKDILDYFINHYPQSLSIKKISDKFGVSERQIKNYIKQINENNSQKELILQNDNGDYFLCDDFRDMTKETSHPEYLPKERVSTIISMLVLSDTPINIFDLADELYVSRPTVESDLLKVRRTISPFKLTLDTKNDVVSISGTEKDKRRLVSYMITNETNSGLMNIEQNKFLNDSYHVDFIKDNLRIIFNKCNFVFNDYSLNNIVLHLIITIDRLKSKCSIDEVLPPNLTTHVEQQAARMIADFLSKNYDVAFSDYELRNLIIFLSCNLSTVNYNFVNEKNLSSYVSSESNYLARLILLKISDYYFLDDFDEIFATRFILHINNLLKRLHSNFSVRNPMAKDIMKTYPLIFDISVFVADIIQQETGYVINRDEISLIALHIGSFIESSKANKSKLSAIYVYSDYHQIYQYNITKLQKKYSDSINLMYSMSVEDFYSSNISVDMIISEHPLDKGNPIVVSPFITDNELDRITNYTEHLIKQKDIKQFDISFQAMFNKNLFFRNVEGNDEFNIIENILNKIEPFDYFNSTFKENVLQREKLSSTCFQHGIAIPHSISQQVNKSFISFTCFDKYQQWGDDQVKLVIIIGIAYHERKIFRSVFNHLVKVFTDQASIQMISKCRTYEELVKTVSNLQKE